MGRKNRRDKITYDAERQRERALEKLRRELIHEPQENNRNKNYKPKNNNKKKFEKKQK